MGPRSLFFLGMNTAINPDADTVELSCKAYIESMADKYMPDWRNQRAPKQPCDGALRDAYETALKREVEPDPALRASFSGKVGAMIYASPCTRVDIAQPVALLARALTFPTTELDALADKCLLYMAHTADLSVTVDPRVDSEENLYAESDSDWSVGHSTTGFVLMLAGCPIVYSSKRQPCIALSSTEAEIIAASTTASEICYVRTLLAEMGLEQDEPTTLYVDNSGAVELSRDRKSCHRSRHVDRRFFKVRELEAMGVVRVKHIPTDRNRADLLTKALPREAFNRHRASLMRE